LNFNYKNVSATNLILQVMDLQGKIVAQSTFDDVLSEGNLKMNTGALSSGVYLLKISSPASLLKTIKVVKD
jgi:hypothetical protein